MGQYHKLVNLDKCEQLQPHRLGTGMKLWEQLANHPGPAAALIVLLASASNGDGSGDLETGPAIIGRWRGDRIAMVGDYDDQQTYDVAGRTMTGAEIYNSDWTDVSDEVAAVLEFELGGKFVETSYGFKNWVSSK